MITLYKAFFVFLFCVSIADPFFEVFSSMVPCRELGSR